MADRNPWQVLISVWRGALLAFWRVPLLIIGCLLLYTLLSGYWLHGAPFRVPGAFLPQAGYVLLQAVVFSPLVVAVMLSAEQRPLGSHDIWSRWTISTGTLIVVRGLIIIGCTLLIRMWGRRFGMMLAAEGPPSRFLALAYVVPGLLFLLAMFLLSVRLILLLPLLESAALKTAIPKAWRAMKGHYGFALAISLAVLLPLVIAERVLNRIFRFLYSHSDAPGPLPLRQWEALAVRSAELTLEYVVIGSLAAMLYVAIRSRQEKAPA